MAAAFVSVCADKQIPLHPVMFRVLLLFPDQVDLAEFILSERLYRVDTKCYTYSMAGVLSEDQIKRARKMHGAYVRLAKKLT